MESTQRLELVRAEVVVAAVPLVQLGRRVVLDHAPRRGCRRRRRSRRLSPPRSVRRGTCPARRRAGRAQADPAALADGDAVDLDRVGLRRRPLRRRLGFHHGGRRRTSAPSSRSSAADRTCGSSPRKRPVQPLEDLWRHGVPAVDDRRSARVGAPRRAFLLVGQRHDPQRQDLVDLGRVVELAGALRRHLGWSAKDDRRCQHDV